MNHHSGRALAAALIAPLLGCSSVCTPAAAAAGPFVYVANTKRDEISQYSAGSSVFGPLSPLTPATVPTGQFPYGIAVNPQGNSVYTADVGPSNAPADTVSQFTINPLSGQLTPKSPATVIAGPGPVELAITPNGNSAYVVGQTGISQFDINATTGALTRTTRGTLDAGRNPEPIAITPNGDYAYVANCPGCITALHGSHPGRSKPPVSTVREYRIDPRSGALSPIASVTTGTGANGIAITPNNRSLYVAVGPIWQYSINPSTGKLTPKSPETVPAAGTAHELAVSPNGKNLYVVTVANNAISQYRINPDLSQYTINPTTGTITPMTRATIPTGSGSLGLAVTPGP